MIKWHICPDWCGTEIEPHKKRWPAVFLLWREGHRRRYFCTDWCRSRFLMAEKKEAPTCVSSC